MTNARIIIGVFAVALIAAVAISLKVSVWRECRAQHSFFYCLELIGNH